MPILKPDLTLDVAALILGATEDPLTGATRYDVALPGETIVVTFRTSGAHKVGPYVAAPTGTPGAPGAPAAPNTGTFGLDIATEARTLGWKPGHSVIVKPGPTKLTLILS